VGDELAEERPARRQAGLRIVVVRGSDVTHPAAITESEKVRILGVECRQIREKGLVSTARDGVLRATWRKAVVVGYPDRRPQPLRWRNWA
jgi:hypothetical protein